MSTAQAERAVSQLYESDSIRSELRDEDASLLMTWGETQLRELADRNLSDDQFDDLAAKFRAMLTAVNVCVGKRKTSPSQHLSMMASISNAAEAAGYKLTPEHQTDFLARQSPLTNQDAISELLGLLKPADTFPPPPSQNIGEAVADVVIPPAEAKATLPPQHEAAPEPPVAAPVVTEAAAETVTPEPPPASEPAPQPPIEDKVEEAPEVITPEPPPVDHTQPPQPEDLPEFPAHPPSQES